MADLDLVRQVGTESHWLAVIAVARPDGSVHTSVVNAGVLLHPVTEDPVVAAVVRGDARKLDYVRAARRASFVFRQGWQWVAVEGAAEIAGPDDLDIVPAEAIPGLRRDVFESAGGTHDDWDEFDRVMTEERRAAVLVRPDRIVSNPGS